MKFRDGKKMAVFGLVAISVMLAVTGQLLLKNGMTKIGKSNVIELLTTKFFVLVTNPFVISGLFLYGVGSIVWMAVLSQADLSYAYPLAATGYILIAILSWIFFKEPLTAAKIGGILLIIIGVIMIGSKL